MANAFTLRWNLDQPCVAHDSSAEVTVLVTIEPNSSAGLSDNVTPLPTHLLLLVDVSGSMDYLMRFDPDAESLGESLTEGQPSEQVVSLVPSRREVACSVLAKLAERMSADDRLTLVAFDDQAYVLAQQVPPTARLQLREAVKALGEVGGGGTSLGRAIEVVRLHLASTTEPERTRKLVILTDGEDQEPLGALRHAQAIGREHGVPIVAFGTGECKVAFLTELAKTTLAGAFNHLRSETDAEQFFQQVLAGQKNVQATNVALRLWLSPQMHVRDFYRTRPEILYLGDLRPDGQNLVELRLEQMERGKAYEFLFRCIVPRRAANQRFRIAKAILTFDLPGQKRTMESLEANIVVEYSADAHRAQERRGAVRRVLARAEVQRQVLTLQSRIDTLERAEGTDHDRTVVAKLLQDLIQKHEDFGDRAQANFYRDLDTQFRKRGLISQEMLNRSLAASSRAEEMVVAQDIDF
jgi:hypothetical protein